MADQRREWETPADPRPGEPRRETAGREKGRNGQETSPLHVRCISDFTELSRVAVDWNNLATQSSATIYQTYEWCTLWWKHLGKTPERSIHVLLFLEGTTLRGLAPFFLRRIKGFGKTRFYRIAFLGSGVAFNRSFGFFLDDGPSDYLDFIVEPGFGEAVAQAFVNYLESSSPWIDEVELLNVADDSFVRAVLVPFLVHRGTTCLVHRAELCSRLSVPRTFDDFKAGLSSNARRRMTQARRAADEVFTILNGADERTFEYAFGEMIRMHQRRWNELGFSGFFSKPEFTAFQKEVGETFLRKGWLWFKVATIDGRSAGARLGFVFNGAIYDYLSGLDISAVTSKHRPGLSLLSLMLEDCIAHRMHTLDLLRGDESYKFEFQPRSFFNSNVVIRPGEPILGVELCYDLFRVLQFLGYLLGREFHLFRVQMHVKGFVKGLSFYTAFRWKRLLEKIRRPSSNHQIV